MWDRVKVMLSWMWRGLILLGPGLAIIVIIFMKTDWKTVPLFGAVTLGMVLAVVLIISVLLMGTLWWLLTEENIFLKILLGSDG